MDPAQESSSKFQTPGAWYEQSFGRRYLMLYDHRDDGAAQEQIDRLIQRLGLKAPARVLDICCGTGRHLAAMRNRGLDAFGLDLSPQLLQRAQARPEARGRILRADIRAIPFAPVFDAAINLFNSFGYFDSDDENFEALRQMTQILKPGGVLAIDHFHPPGLAATLKPQTLDQKEGWTIRQSRTIEQGRIIKRIRLESDAGRSEDYLESVRLYQPRELAGMMEAAGLEGIRIAADETGRPLDDGHPRMLLTGIRTRTTP